MSGRFVKTLSSGAAEALTTTEVYAEVETFFHAPNTNAGDITLTDENNVLVMIFEPGRRDRVPVARNVVPTGVAGVGDWQRLSQWKAQGTTGDKLAVDAR